MRWAFKIKNNSKNTKKVKNSKNQKQSSSSGAERHFYFRRYRDERKLMCQLLLTSLSVNSNREYSTCRYVYYHLLPKMFGCLRWYEDIRTLQAIGSAYRLSLHAWRMRSQSPFHNTLLGRECARAFRAGNWQKPIQSRAVTRLSVDKLQVSFRIWENYCSSSQAQLK